MLLATIVVKDAAAPVEVNSWLDDHVEATIHFIETVEVVFYIFYTI